MDRRSAMAGVGAAAVAAVLPAAESARLVRVTADVFRADVPSANGNVYPLRVLKGVPALLTGATVRAGQMDTPGVFPPAIGRVDSAVCTADGWVVAVADVPADLAADMVAGRVRLMPSAKAVSTGVFNITGGMDIEQVQDIFLYPCPADQASWPREG